MNDSQGIVERNWRTCLRLEFLWPFFLGTPCMAIYYTEVMHLTDAQVLQLQFILQSTIVAVGVQLGYAGDRYGLRRLAIAGSVLQCVQSVFFAFCESFWQFTLALIGTGLYLSSQMNVLRSMMMSSLGYEEYERYESRAALMRQLGILSGVVVGGVLLAVGQIRLIYQLQPLIALTGLLVSLRLIEPSSGRMVHSIGALKRVARHMLLDNPGIRAALLLDVSVLSTGFACFWMFQARLELSLAPAYFGFVFLAQQAIPSLFSTLIPTLRNKGLRDIPLWGMSILLLHGLAVVTGLTTDLVSIVALMLVQVCVTMLVGVLLRMYLYETLPNDYSTRTAELSVSTTLTALGCAVFGWGTSVAVDVVQVGTTFVLVGVFGFCLSSVAFCLFYRHIRKSR